MKSPKDYIEFCKANIFPELEELEEKRKAISSKRYSLLLVVLILLVTQIIAYLLGYIPFWTILIGIFIVPFVFAYIYNHMFQDDGIVEEMQDIVVKKSAIFLLEKPVFDAKLFIDYGSYFSNSRLFLMLPEHYGGRNQAKGLLGNYPTLFSEIDCGYDALDDEGKSKWQSIFKGLFLITAFEKDLGIEAVVLPSELENNLYLLGKQIQKQHFQRGNSVPFHEDKEFSKHYVVYAEKPLETSKVLSSLVRKMLLNFSEKTGLQVYLSFMGSKIYFAFHGETLLNVDLKKTLLDFEQLQNFYLCLSLVEIVLDDFNKRFVTKKGIDWSI